MYLLEGKIIAQQEKKNIVDTMRDHGITPGLATILVGDNPASNVYVKAKIKACEEVGFYGEHYNLDYSSTTEDVLAVITSLNKNPEIHGILVQSPPPPHIDMVRLVNAIDPLKDVDCFHPLNLGKFFSGQSDFAPCTPTGVITMLDSIPNFSYEGKSALIIGRSNIVGKPMAILLTNRHATVSLAHSRTKNLDIYLQKADIIIAATGQAEMIKGDMVKEGVVIIDVGIDRVLNPITNKSRLVGDVEFESVKDKAYAISPVPGGVGPMTIVTLLSNTLKLALQSISLK